MIQEIVKEEDFLSQPTAVATSDDLQVAQNLIEIMEANAERCVDLTANMIGIFKRIIVVDDDGSPLVMFNPQIIICSELFEAEEECLSQVGMRKTIRYKPIKVQYQNRGFQVRIKTFKGWTAQIIRR